MRIVFMGTPEFALPSLTALIESKQPPVAVVTQQDRPKGRGRRSFPPPVKHAAESSGIPVLQPQKMKDPAFLGELERLRPDLIVVVAFGRILPPEILKLPPMGCLNVHASLLPKYRGAAPIAWAIIRGEKKTGVSTMKMDEGLDTGAVYLEAETEILPEDTAGTLGARLSVLGGELLLKTIDGLRNGLLTPVPQDDSGATPAPILKKEDGEVDWTLPAKRIADLVRGLDPWPGAYTFHNDQLWKLWKVSPGDAPGTARPGVIIKVARDQIEVGTGQGALRLHEVQMANARRMPVREFLAGHPVEEGTILGE
jgi:methionyl-tRNA formyltransferase